jgi:hypothetical protein
MPLFIATHCYCNAAVFKCTLTLPDGTANKVLVRIYGAGTEAIIDRDKEIRVRTARVVVELIC